MRYGRFIGLLSIALGAVLSGLAEYVARSEGSYYIVAGVMGFMLIGWGLALVAFPGTSMTLEEAKSLSTGERSAFVWDAPLLHKAAWMFSIVMTPMVYFFFVLFM